MAGWYHQKEVYVISSNESFHRYVRENLPDGDYTVSGGARSGTEARQLLIGRSFPVVLVNIPLSDENGAELAADLAERTPGGIIAVVKAEQEQEVRQYLEPQGVCVLGKPFPHAAFHQALYDAAAVSARMQTVTAENARLQMRLADLRIINRAKSALMQYLGMTEEQAHRYIEQQAMNQRITKRKAAENILKTYEDQA